MRTPKNIRFAAAFGFGLVHVAALGVLLVGFSWQGVSICLASYYLRMFAITAGFHRYFSHRTYKLGRVPQFLLAFLGQTSAQRGVLWWSAHHRHHHRYSDLPEDIHSPLQRGFWWSHMGWILSSDYDHTDLARIPDLAKFPELRWLNRNEFLATMVYALLLYFAFGWVGLFYGYFLSTVLLWHGTFSINSLMHVFGKRVFETKDDSRNSFVLALVTMGEGWHNNHHHYPGSASQGFRWWQVDASFYILWVLERLGIVKELRRAPARLRQGREALAETRVRLGAALDTASASMGERVEALTRRWDELKGGAWVSAHQRLAELEAARVSVVARLEELQAEYAASFERAKSAARNRSHQAAAAAERRLTELKAEMERVRMQLAEILANLVATAESLA